MRLLPYGGNVRVLHRRVNQFLRSVESRELVQALVGYLGDPEMRLAGIMSTLLDVCFGKNLEHGGLAHLRQTDNASLHECGNLSDAKLGMNAILHLRAMYRQCEPDDSAVVGTEWL